MATEITREEWDRETERLCPSGQAYSAYVALEQFIVEETDLNVTYESVSRGKSDYATFYAFAGVHCSVAQVYKGQCQLNWKLKTKTAGLSEEQRELIGEAYEAFRTKLEGQEGKGWETVKVLRLGEDNVHEAVKAVAGSLCEIVKTSEVSS
jgi:hypothetical protein